MLEHDGPVEVKPKLTKSRYNKMLSLMVASKRQRHVISADGMMSKKQAKHADRKLRSFLRAETNS